MKTNHYKGWKDVYNFTLRQNLRNKTFRIMTAIFFILSLVSMPLLDGISKKEEEKPSVSPIQKVYVLNETELPEMDFSGVQEQKEYEKIEFLNTKESLDTLTNVVKDEKGSVLLHITEGQEAYSFSFIKGAESNISEDELWDFDVFVEQSFYLNRAKAIGITQEQRALLEAPVHKEVQQITESGVEKIGFSLTQSEGAVAQVILFIAVIFISFGGEAIASSVLTEKSTKVIEFLMISIRPMAIIVGKVLAMVTITLIQLAVILVSTFVSGIISQTMFSDGKIEWVPQILSNLAKEGNYHIGFFHVLLAFLIFMTGVLMFGFLAGLMGATVSRMEELSEGIMGYAIFLIIGAYMFIALINMNMNGVSGGVFPYVTFLVPFSGMLATPIYLLLGKLSLLWGLLTLVILFISLCLIIRFAANVYETLILYRGNKIKMKQLLGLARTKKERTVL